MASWTDIKMRWSAGWKALHRRAMDKLGRSIQRDPESFRPQVEAALADLQASWAHLRRIQAMLSRIQDPQLRARTARAFAAMMQRYHTLAAGLYADAEQSQRAEVSGAVVPLLIIGGILFGVAAIAWAVASREHAKNLREQTALADHELAARVEASKEGRTLQDTTLPEQPAAAPLLGAGTTGAAGSKVGLMLLGGLAIAAAALAAPTLLKR